jgi:hypothetical protein
MAQRPVSRPGVDDRHTSRAVEKAWQRDGPPEISDPVECEHQQGMELRDLTSRTIRLRVYGHSGILSRFGDLKNRDRVALQVVDEVSLGGAGPASPLVELRIGRSLDQLCKLRLEFVVQSVANRGEPAVPEQSRERLDPRGDQEPAVGSGQCGLLRSRSDGLVLSETSGRRVAAVIGAGRGGLVVVGALWDRFCLRSGLAPRRGSCFAPLVDNSADARGDVLPRAVAIAPLRHRAGFHRERLKSCEWRGMPVGGPQDDRDNARFAPLVALERPAEFVVEDVVGREEVRAHE